MWSPGRGGVEGAPGFAGGTSVPGPWAWVALVPLVFSLGVLPLMFGGRYQGWLLAAQVSTFAMVALLAIVGTAWVPQEGGGRAVRWVLVVASIAAIAAAVFSREVGASVPEALVWLWLCASALVTGVVATHRPAREALGAVLLGSVFLEAFWSFFVWWGGQDPAKAQAGTFYASNQYAGYLLLLAPGFLALCLVSSSRAWSAGAALAAAYLYLGIALSGSRAGAVAAGVGVVVMGLLVARRHLVRTLVRLTLTALAVVGLGLVMTSPMLFRSARTPSGLGGAIAVKGTDTTDLTQRIHWDVGALRIGVHRPLVGTGLGTFGDMLFKTQQPQWQWSRYVHNQYLESFAEGGVVLLAAMVALPLVGLGGGLRGLRRGPADDDYLRLGLVGGLVGGALHLAVDHDWSYPAYAVAFVVVATLAAASWGPPATEAPLRASRSRGWIRWGIGALASLCLVVAVGQYASVRLLRGPGSRRLATIHVAMVLAPYLPGPYEQEALVRADQGGMANLRAARSLLGDAIARNQLSPSLRWELAQVDVQLEDLAGARSAYRAAIVIAPLSTDGYLAAATFEAQVAKNIPGALAILDEGVTRLRPVPAPSGTNAGVTALLAAKGRLGTPGP